MKKYLQQRINGEKLSQTEAEAALTIVGKGEANTSEIAAFLMSYLMQPISSQELMGFRQAMLSLSVPIDFSAYDAMDIVGTGGDNKNTFNISTTTAFVVAGTGQNVAKHGNYGVSSAVGSSTVLEYLGAKFTNDTNFLQKKIETAGICFLHAPLFHPAMKNVAPIRKELGLKTFFNILGPILNPARLTKLLLGVYSPEIIPLYKQVCENIGANYGIIYALDGYDEISLTGDFIVETSTDKYLLSPQNLNFQPCQATELLGGNDSKTSAKIMIDILENKATKAQKEVVLANAGIALHCTSQLSIEEAIARAKESIESGKAYTAFKNFIKN